MSERIDVPDTGAEEGVDHAVNACLPRLMEDGAIRLGRHRSKAVHPTHVVNPIHRDVRPELR